jgi:hypothetical protein
MKRSSAAPASQAEQAEIDLFNALVSPEDVRLELRNPVDTSAIAIKENPHSKIAYPWNPVAVESGEFFNQIEADSILQGFDDSEIAQKADEFFNGLNQIWEKSLQTTLARKFATVPQAILAQIADRAAQVAKTGNSMIDQLADCVQSALPQWNVEDLQVLARPVAYAMRGDQVESPFMNRDWATLSETEQAKLSITIARYALSQLDE